MIEEQAKMDREGRSLGKEHETARNFSEGKLNKINDEFLAAGKADERVHVGGTEAHGKAVASEARKIIDAIKPVRR
jgi:hypothetical protein